MWAFGDEDNAVECVSPHRYRPTVGIRRNASYNYAARIWMDRAILLPLVSTTFFVGFGFHVEFVGTVTGHANPLQDVGEFGLSK